MYTVQSATTPVFIRDCGTYLILKVLKTRIYRKEHFSIACANNKFAFPLPGGKPGFQIVKLYLLRQCFLQFTEQ